MKLKGKIALITGGSGGIGRAIAIEFANEGAIVILATRNKSKLIAAKEEILKKNGKAIVIQADISNFNQVKRLISEVTRKFGTIDILVNCAGIQEPIGCFYNNNINLWRKNIETNLFGTIFCSKAVLPGFMNKKFGKIINFSGGGATCSRPNFSAYAAAKAAVVRFTETLAEELKDYNVDVNSIAPGPINTEMLNEILLAGKGIVGKKEYTEAIKRKKNGGSSPQKAAELSVFLASDKSNGLTGRLISAVWDDWKNIDINKIKKSSLYTLRRIDEKNYFEKIK